MKFLKHPAAKILSLIVGTKIALYLTTFLFHLLFIQQSTSDSWATLFVNMWTRWDALHYLGIANQGYTFLPPDNVRIVFYPLYPLLVWLISLLGLNLPWAGLLVNNVASIVGLTLFYRLVTQEWGEEKGLTALLLILFFPTAYFFNAPYSEGTFFLLSVGAWLSARKGNWMYAGIWAGLACLTRVAGLALLPALLVEFFLQKKEKPISLNRVAWLVLIPVCFGLYLILNKRVMGSFFAYTSFMETVWKKELAFPWQAFFNCMVRYHRVPFNGYSAMVYLSEFISGLALLGATIYSFYRLRLSYAVYLSAMSLLVLSTTFLQSTPRYMLMAFPLFLLGTELSKKKTALLLWLVLSLQLQTLLAGWFSLGHWAF